MIPFTDTNGAVLFILPGWLCLQCAGVWFALFIWWKEDGKLAESLRSVLLPVGIGQIAVLLLTVAFQVSNGNRVLIVMDNGLNVFYARYHNWIAFRFLTFACIVAVLIVLNFFWRGARFVTRFITLQKYLNVVAGALAAFGAFTFSAQYPYAAGSARDARVMPRPKGEKEDAEIKKLNVVAAEALKKSFASMQRSQLLPYANLLWSVDENVRWTHHEDVLKETLDPLFSGDAPQPDAGERDSAESGPSTGNVAAGEAWLGFETVATSSLGNLLRIPEGMIGEFARSAVELLSEKMFEWGFRAPVRERIDAMAGKIAPWLTSRLQLLERWIAAVGGTDRFVEDQRRAVEKDIATEVAREHPVKSPARVLLDDMINRATDPARADEK